MPKVCDCTQKNQKWRPGPQTDVQKVCDCTQKTQKTQSFCQLLIGRWNKKKHCDRQLCETLGFLGFLGTVTHFLHIGLGARPPCLVFLGTVTHFEHIGFVFLGTVTHFKHIGVVFVWFGWPAICLKVFCCVVVCCCFWFVLCVVAQINDDGCG